MKTLSMLAMATMLVWSSPALAKDKTISDNEQNRAVKAFKTGQALFDKGEYLEAAAAFERAYYLSPHPSVLANIGYCYDEAGNYPRAVEVFRKYVKHPNSKTPERNRKIAEHLEKLQSKVGDLRVNCFADRCEVNVDNVSRGLAPTTAVLLAGAHNVDVVTGDGSLNRHYEIIVNGGETVVLDVNPNDSASGSSPLPDSSSTETESRRNREPPRLRAPFWIATAATIAGAGTAAVLGGLTHKARADFRSGGSTDADQKKLGENLRLGTNIALGITAAAAATAIVLAIIDMKRNPGRDSKDRKTAELPKKFAVNLTVGAYWGLSVGFP